MDYRRNGRVRNLRRRVSLNEDMAIALGDVGFRGNSGHRVEMRTLVPPFQGFRLFLEIIADRRVAKRCARLMWHVVSREAD